MDIIPFREVVDNYKVVFFDAFGVLKNYKGLIPGIEKTFDYLKEKDIEFYILTNDASRSPEELAQSYIDKGLDFINADKIISSGMLAREYLKYKVNHGTVAYLGTEASAHYVETVGLKTISIKDIDLDDENNHLINALVMLDDEGFDWKDDINKAINLLRRFNMPVIVANTDSAYPVSKEEVAIAVGSLADMMEFVVRKTFIRFGKPDAQMFNFAFQHVHKNGTVYDKSEILMVGDSLNTDIIGGNKFGIDTALVLTGNTLPKNALIQIESSGIIPNYMCESAVV
ncbi:HAD-IIA family hydrolase [Flexithrix dorotheae]|uniref:HAD-IIA family hydrolase n=1 Tax=Flexithrix dorotheae TaxID=70993 RepID=UPI00036738E5|nr:HAD-IIA family hydrolase [Flexithrix dorotheae]